MNKEDLNIEDLLLCYRPAGPASELRTQVLDLWKPEERLRRSALKWTAVAAVLLLSLGLELMTQWQYRETANMLSADRVESTSEAKEIVEVLDKHGLGKRYVEFVLKVGSRPSGNWSISSHHTDSPSEL